MDTNYDKKEGMRYNRNVDYYIPKDLGYTFGTVYKNLQTWVKADLKGIVDFNHVNIDTRVMYDKDFLWSKGLIAQTRKPCLSLKFNLDFSSNSAHWDVPAWKNTDAAKWNPSTDFTYPVFGFEDDNDFTNNVAISIGFKNVKTTMNIGIATNTRMEATNIINYWNTRRSDNLPYELRMMIDFKIPTVVIKYICKKFNINIKNHHEVLYYLNNNSVYNVYYAMDGSNGKFYYFIRYKAITNYRFEGITNPQGWEVTGFGQANVWTFDRTLEMDIQIPYIMAFTKYGDHIDFHNLEEEINDELLEDKLGDTAILHTRERLIEIERILDKKHAIKQIEFSYTDEDIIKHENGYITSNKISIADFYKEDVELNKTIEWAFKKGYTNLDMFNFKLYKINKRKYTISPQIKEYDITKENDNPEIEKVFGKEYLSYIKNINDMYFIDVSPDMESFYIGVIYFNLDIEQEYKLEHNEEHITNDDFGIQQYKDKDTIVNPDIDKSENKRKWY